ncbi:MAG: helix-turn-helix domain-containing protein [Cytophagaceae bacterium]
MQYPDNTNDYSRLAYQYANTTLQNLFLTGKAGAGKTTFLKFLTSNTHKKFVVAAPTGVAAINAGGVTLHSLFQLPLGSFIPDRAYIKSNLSRPVHNQHSLLQHLRFGNEKRKLLEELELLIIDEVSMARADIIDAIDTILKHVRENQLPFGGIQVLFIGDLFQLPPVTNDQEWEILGKYYNSPFFFDAHVLKQAQPLYLELKKVYRQSDERFLSLLNRIRNNNTTAGDIETLKKFYKPGYKPENKGEYITLTTHNYRADQINKEELEKLPGKVHIFEAEIKDEFNENAMPADKRLFLKEGAQIMFIRNDTSDAKLYYNGKIATIKKIDNNEIYISFSGEESVHKIEKETWKNVRYQYEKESDSIKEETLGSFKQYPIRLAWAITIHKSQGLTFEKAIIDAGQSFAPGQVYVALSRLTSLEGLVLSSPIDQSVISTASQAMRFAETELEINVLNQILSEKQRDYILNSLKNAFEWDNLINETKMFMEFLLERQIPEKAQAAKLIDDIIQVISKQKETADKFLIQLDQLIKAKDLLLLDSRMQAAAGYFTSTLEKEIIFPLKDHHQDMKKRSKTKRYTNELSELIAVLATQIRRINNTCATTKGLKEGISPDELLKKTEPISSPYFEDQKNTSAPKKEKQAKGETQRISLEMFLSGKTITEIAEARSMVSSTIEGHLASFIPTGEIKLGDLVTQEKAEAIRQVIIKTGEYKSSSLIKQFLGDEYSYGEIKAVLKSMEVSENISIHK